MKQKDYWLFRYAEAARKHSRARPDNPLRWLSLFAGVLILFAPVIVYLCR